MTYKQSSARAWIIVILLLFYVFYQECRSGGRKSSNLLINRSFTILRSGEALTSFNKNNLVDFSVEKMFSEAFRDDYFLRIREKLLSFTWSSSHPRIYERSFVCSSKPSHSAIRHNSDPDLCPSSKGSSPEPLNSRPRDRKKQPALGTRMNSLVLSNLDYTHNHIFSLSSIGSFL